MTKPDIQIGDQVETIYCSTMEKETITVTASYYDDVYGRYSIVGYVGDDEYDIREAYLAYGKYYSIYEPHGILRPGDAHFCILFGHENIVIIFPDGNVECHRVR